MAVPKAIPYQLSLDSYVHPPQLNGNYVSHFAQNKFKKETCSLLLYFMCTSHAFCAHINN